MRNVGLRISSVAFICLLLVTFGHGKSSGNKHSRNSRTGKTFTMKNIRDSEFPTM